MNIVVLSGNLTADPEMRYVAGGKAVTTFRIAVNDGFGDKRTTTFLNCEAWERLAETVAEFTRKGRKVAVTGSIADDSWTDKENKKRFGIKIKCRNVEFLDRGDDVPQAPVTVPDDLSDLAF